MNTATSIVVAATTNNNVSASSQPTENAKQPQQKQTAQQVLASPQRSNHQTKLFVGELTRRPPIGRASSLAR